jgi:hypothetical protein
MADITTNVEDWVTRGPFGAALIHFPPPVAGMNNRADPRYIGKMESASLTNMVITNVGRTEKRSGSHLAAGTFGTSGPMRALVNFAPDDGSTKRLVEVDYTAIKTTSVLVQGATSVMASWIAASVAASPVSNVLTNQTDITDTFAIQAANKVIIFNGTDDVRTMDTAATVTHWTGGGATILLPSVCAEFMQQRLFAVPRTARNRVDYSDVGNPLVWSHSVNSVKFDEGRDGVIVALKKRRNGELIVFLSNGIEALYQDFPTYQATDLGTLPIVSWTRKIIEPAIGCGARDSVASYGDDIIFLDHEGNVRTLGRTEVDTQGGIASLALSEKLGGTLPDGINLSKMYLSQGIVFRDLYLLAFPSTSATSNDTVVVYDFKQRAWAGIWSGVPVGKWVVSDLETSNQRRLYFSHATANGAMYELLDGVYTDLRIADSVTAGTAITYEDKARQNDFGSISQKLGSFLEVEAEGDYNASLAVVARLDGGAEQSIGTMTLRGTGLTLSFNLDDNGTPPTFADIPRQTTKFHLESLGRWVGMQLIFRNTDSGKVVKFIGHRLGAFIEPVGLE